MEIILYKVKKRDNSTYRPTTGDGRYPVTGYIFEPCSILRPTIKIEFGANESPHNYNYMYIPQFERYYYLGDWTTDGVFWKCNSVVDPLASWKTDLLASTQYVVRAASEFDGKIVDNLYPCKADTQYSEVQCVPETGSIFYDNYGTGSYILGVIAPGGGTVGGVAYYGMSNAVFNNFMNQLLSNIDWLDIDAEELSQNIQKMLFNPFEYLVSCYWFPVPPSVLLSGAATTGQINYGWWQMTVPGAYKLDSPESAFVQRYTASLPSHPLAGTRGTYLNTSPFTRRWLNFPPFGRTALDTTTLINRQELQIVCRIDIITGKAQLTAGGEENALCIYENAQLGVPIQISQITTDFRAAVTTLGSAASTAAGLIGVGGVAAAGAGAVVGGLAMGVDIGQAAGAIGNALTAAFNDVSHSGSNGSLVGYGLKPTIGSLFAIPVDDYNAERGRPLCKAKQLSSLSGYILCENADVNFACFKEEATAIKSYLNSGCYIE